MYISLMYKNLYLPDDAFFVRNICISRIFVVFYCEMCTKCSPPQKKIYLGNVCRK